MITVGWVRWDKAKLHGYTIVDGEAQLVALCNRVTRAHGMRPRPESAGERCQLCEERARVIEAAK